MPILKSALLPGCVAGADPSGRLWLTLLPSGSIAAADVRSGPLCDGLTRLFASRCPRPFRARALVAVRGAGAFGSGALSDALAQGIQQSVGELTGIPAGSVVPLLSGQAGELTAMGPLMTQAAEALRAVSGEAPLAPAGWPQMQAPVVFGEGAFLAAGFLAGDLSPVQSKMLCLLTDAPVSPVVMTDVLAQAASAFRAQLAADGCLLAADTAVLISTGTAAMTEINAADSGAAQILSRGFQTVLDSLFDRLHSGSRVRLRLEGFARADDAERLAPGLAAWVRHLRGTKPAPSVAAECLRVMLAAGAPAASEWSRVELKAGDTGIVSGGRARETAEAGAALARGLAGKEVLSLYWGCGPVFANLSL